MAGSRLDELSRVIGAIEKSVDDLTSRAAEDRDIQAKRHEDNQRAIRLMEEASTKNNTETKSAIDALTRELKEGTLCSCGIQPQISALQVSRSRIAVLASIRTAGLWVVGRAVEAGLGWMVEKLLKMKFGG